MSFCRWCPCRSDGCSGGVVSSYFSFRVFPESSRQRRRGGGSVKESAVEARIASAARVLLCGFVCTPEPRLSPVASQPRNGLPLTTLIRVRQNESLFPARLLRGRLPHPLEWKEAGSTAALHPQRKLTGGSQSAIPGAFMFRGISLEPQVPARVSADCTTRRNRFRHSSNPRICLTSRKIALAAGSPWKTPSSGVVHEERNVDQRPAVRGKPDRDH